MSNTRAIPVLLRYCPSSDQPILCFQNKSAALLIQDIDIKFYFIFRPEGTYFISNQAAAVSRITRVNNRRFCLIPSQNVFSLRSNRLLLKCSKFSFLHETSGSPSGFQKARDVEGHSHF